MARRMRREHEWRRGRVPAGNPGGGGYITEHGNLAYADGRGSPPPAMYQPPDAGHPAAFALSSLNMDPAAAAVLLRQLPGINPEMLTQVMSALGSVAKPSSAGHGSMAPPSNAPSNAQLAALAGLTGLGNLPGMPAMSGHGHPPAGVPAGLGNQGAGSNLGELQALASMLGINLPPGADMPAPTPAGNNPSNDASAALQAAVAAYGLLPPSSSAYPSQHTSHMPVPKHRRSEPLRSVFVSDLHPGTSWQTIKDHFKKLGPVSYCKVLQVSVSTVVRARPLPTCRLFYC